MDKILINLRHNLKKENIKITKSIFITNEEVKPLQLKVIDSYDIIKSMLEGEV